MPATRKRNLFAPSSSDPFPLSRSKIECWVKCPRCFFNDRRLGITPPGMPSMTLNRAVDALMKAEFDSYRKKQTPHPAFLKMGIQGIPLSHPQMDVWRSNFKGISWLHKPTNLLVSGAPDDILDIDGIWAILDFKATSSKEPVVALDTTYRQAYRRQEEIYSWLFKMNGHPVGRKAYLLFANACQNRPALDGRLDFDMQPVEIVCNTDWIEPTLLNIKSTLMLDVPPSPAPDCELCNYVKATTEAVKP